ncbi:MAG: hypothetical protein CMJ18_25565 [Phycisphaeraceae bacterium]|nr:hypothetical protein [Phycisphaeraceae bacterium]
MLAIFAPLICGALSLLLPRAAIGARVSLALAGPVLALTLLGQFAAGAGIGAELSTIAWMPTLQLNIQLNADHLGMFFAFLVAGIGLLIVLYARAYFGPDADSLYRFYPSLLLFMTAMLGVALADGFMLLLLFWEMTSISSFLLIGWERDKKDAVRKAMQAFIVTGAGGLVMMGGLILLGVHTSCWSFSALLAQRDTLAFDTLTVASFIMIFAGAAAKSAQVPLHFWLPGAMAAPTPVSAYLHSATMVKAGVYLTGRMWPIFAVSVGAWPVLIVPLGAVTMVYGAFIALQKTDLKQIFAYTTVSQLGLLMTMYGLAGFEYHHEPNLLWDVTQILNHAFYKAPLFILAGAIGHVASRELPELKGLFHRGRTERIMTIVLLLAAYGLAAGPLTVSFTAKELFFYQIVHAKEAMGAWTWPLVAAGIATGMFNVAILVRLATTLLSRSATEAHAEAHGHGHGHDDHHESGPWPAFLWIPGLVIVSFQFVGGIVPGAWETLFGWLDPSRGHYDFHASVGHFPMTWDALLRPGLPLYMSFAAIALGLGLGFAPLLRKTWHDPFDHAYPGFYTLSTRGGGWLFSRFQTGHMGQYIAIVFASIVLLFAWSIGFDFAGLLDRWPATSSLDSSHPMELRAGYLITVLVCIAAVLLPVVRDRASRVLVLGTVGFTVTAVYYLYKAPDLALTQISIEIVSLILFLLVLSLLPSEAPGPNIWIAPRLVLSILVGGVMFWMTLTSSIGDRPPMPYFTKTGEPIAHLGHYFLRNSHHAQDTMEMNAHEVYGGVVDRGAAHQHSFGTHGAGAAHVGHGTANELASGPPLTAHKGGGGRNVVNVILVDFRGFDTMGEITVLGLAALGVWSLLRRSRNAAAAVGPAAETTERGGDLRVDIPEPDGGPDPEDEVVARLADRSSPA